MTSKKTVSWSAQVNLGNDEFVGLVVTDEVKDKDDAREVFAFACGQFLGVAKGANEETAQLLKDFVARFVQEEEAKPVSAPAAPAAKWAPKITKASWDEAQAAKAAAPTVTPTIDEQTAAAVAQCVKPPVDVEDIARQQHADKLKADLERLQADHDTRVARRAPSAPPTPEASAPAAAASAPPAPKTAPQPGVVCVNCGAAVSASQAKLSQLFQSKTLCKKCMEAP